MDSLAFQLSIATLIVINRQFLVALWSKMSNDDNCDNDISGESNTGRPKDIQQYAYVQKALFKLNMVITLDFLDVTSLW